MRHKTPILWVYLKQYCTIHSEFDDFDHKNLEPELNPGPTFINLLLLVLIPFPLSSICSA